MTFRVTRALTKPVRSALNGYHRLRYDFAEAQQEQERLFTGLGLDRKAGLVAVQAVLASKPSLASSMQSEHHVLFGAISEAKPIKNILEIGTFDGRGTAMLSSLFPGASIESIDLADDDPLFSDS